MNRKQRRAARQAPPPSPDVLAPLLAQATAALRAGNAAVAHPLAAQAVKLAPRSAEAHRLLGLALAGLARPDEARAELGRALELAPGWPEASLELARLLWQAERLDELLALLAPLDGPTIVHAEAHALRGQALMVLDRRDEAAEAFQRTLSLAPGHAEAAARLAAIAIENGDGETALAGVSAALATAGAQPRLIYLRAVALGMLGREQEAEADTARVRAALLEALDKRGAMPAEIYVQLSRRCNLRCTMCGHGVWKDNSGFMSDEVFARTLDECTAAGIRRMTILAAQGEPFLHPRAFELMEGAVAHGLAVSVVTNGTPFTAERIARLAGLGLASVQLSFAGWDKESYEGVYVGAKFEKVVETLRAIDAALKPTATSFMVKAVSPDNSPEFVGRTRAFLAGLGIDKVVTVAPNNFGGTVEIGRYWPNSGIWSHRNVDRHRRTVCRVLMNSVGVYVDGTVTACGCYDANAALAIGDIGEGLAAIRRGPRFTALLDAFRRGDVSALPLCAKCDDPFG